MMVIFAYMKELKTFEKIKILLIIPAALIFNFTKSQTLTLTGEIFEYATYYINSFDITTGATNTQIFRYQ